MEEVVLMLNNFSKGEYMKKLFVVALAVALVSASVSVARAEEGSELEISGNVTNVTGWQRPIKNAPGLTGAGILNDGLAAPGGLKADQFGFFLDQTEIDLAKSFGENIRIRSDLDFSPHRAPAAGGVYVEQAYVTANVPAGNGVEFLVGRFNSGIGLDPIDRNELSTVSFSNVHRTLLPHNITGARTGYDFSEATRFEAFVVNKLSDAAPAALTDIPSFGFNLSYAWGEEGTKSWVKLSGVGGPEKATKRHWSFLGDLSGSWAVSDAFSVGAEGVYRQDNAPAGVTGNAQFFGGQLKARYAFSDVWDGTLRYGIVREQKAGGAGAIVAANPVYGTTGLGAKGTLHTASLATGYQIADGARFVLEGNLDLVKPSVGGTSYIPGFAGMFAYSF